MGKPRIIEINGKEYVRIPVSRTKINGKVRYAREFGKQCFWLNIPIEKFDPSRYNG